MPEELAIVIIVVVAVGWLSVKVMQVAADVVQSAYTGVGNSLRLRGARKKEKRRLALQVHIRQSIPDDLDAAENYIQQMETDWIKRKEAANWIPERPQWDRLDFIAYTFASQGPAKRQFNIFDIHGILLPENPTWEQREQELLSMQCGYPSNFPTVTCPPSK